ncbi:MAG TPA: response regulator transcription factor [Candidatus Saccharimonadales bacterium]|nr:response regulator transcription factor [Candidatus Saccharimonadales bacterium]
MVRSQVLSGGAGDLTPGPERDRRSDREGQPVDDEQDDADRRHGYDMETEPGMAIVGEAADGREALALAQELLPDIVLVDIKMGDWDGVTATRRVRNSVPSTRSSCSRTMMRTSWCSAPSGPAPRAIS